MGWGNFGARPNPPHSGSKARARAACALNNIRSDSGSGDSGAEAPAASATATRLPWADRSPGFVRQVSAMASSTRRNAGMPWRSSGGKYVPAKNGSPSGVRNAVIGQPPEPVMAWTASM